MPEVLSPQDKKYCSECGKLILRRAEICPGCGCRQQSSSNSARLDLAPPELGRPIAPKMITLILLNFLWSGVGNVAIGDKRGWGFIFANIVIFVISFFT